MPKTGKYPDLYVLQRMDTGCYLAVSPWNSWTSNLDEASIHAFFSWPSDAARAADYKFKTQLVQVERKIIKV